MSCIDWKRKQPDQVNPNLSEFNLEAFVSTIIKKGGLDLVATAILEQSHLASLTLKELKKCKAAASWEYVAQSFGLESFGDFFQLPTFSVPVTSLPPSFHREVMKTSAKWLDIYHKREAHDREAAHVCLMEAVCAFKFFVHSLTTNCVFSGISPCVHSLRVVFLTSLSCLCRRLPKPPEAKSSMRYIWLKELFYLSSS